MIPQMNVEATLESARALVAKAAGLLIDDFSRAMASAWGEEAAGESGEEDNSEQISELVETAFLHLLTLTEGLGLSELRATIHATYAAAKESPYGFALADNYDDLSVWLVWEKPFRQFAETISAVYGLKGDRSIRAELLDVLNACQKAVTDDTCFPPPRDEADVHNRIEMVLRCIFPDLLHKPPVNQAVTNFIPDTGLPSLGTLVEYKFMAEKTEAGRIANEILADTRGYQASNWRSIVFVIYETKRFKTLDEWRQLLRGCGVPENITVVLLHGEPPLRAERPMSGGKATARPKLPDDSGTSSGA